MSHFFKSRRERAREERRERRRAFRNAENALDSVKERIVKLEKETGATWSQAQEALREGKDEQARRLLEGYRSARVLVLSLERKRWVFEHQLTRLDVAQSDQEFSSALEELAKLVDIDPGRVGAALDRSDDLLADQSDTDEEWDRVYERMTGTKADGIREPVPDLDALQEKLVREVTGASDTPASKVAESSSAPANRDQRIASGRERVKRLLQKDNESG